jgi:hypothetical protein
MRQRTQGWIMPEADILTLSRLIDERITSSRIEVRHRDTLMAVLHGSAGWCLDLDGIGGLGPPDLGFLPCRSRPMLLAVTAFPSSGTG